MSLYTNVKTRVGKILANSEIAGFVFGIFCEKLKSDTTGPFLEIFPPFSDAREVIVVTD